MAKIADLVDDLTGQLSSMGGGSMGGRSQADPYLQSMSGLKSSVGPVSPVPPTQMAVAPAMAARSSMPPPMDSGASVQQGMMQHSAMESDIMRPPYTTLLTNGICRTTWISRSSRIPTSNARLECRRWMWFTRSGSMINSGTDSPSGGHQSRTTMSATGTKTSQTNENEDGNLRKVGKPKIKCGSPL